METQTYLRCGLNNDSNVSSIKVGVVENRSSTTLYSMISRNAYIAILLMTTGNLVNNDI